MKVIELKAKYKDIKEQALRFYKKEPKKSDLDMIYRGRENLCVTSDGRIVLFLARGIMNAELTKTYYDVVSSTKAFRNTDNRATASGKQLGFSILKDGTKGRANRTSEGVMSSILGYIGRSSRLNYCRETSWTMNNRKYLPVIKAYTKEAERWYRKFCKKDYKEHLEYSKKTNQNFLLGEVFSTITLNKNFRTFYHTDKGNLEIGLSCMSYMKTGKFIGGEFCLPNFGLAVELRNLDLLIVNNREYHGNLAIKNFGNYERITSVFYYRKNIIYCGSCEEELKRVQMDKGNRVIGRLSEDLNHG